MLCGNTTGGETPVAILTGANLRAAIQQVTYKGDVACAVAFWGNGAESLFPNPAARQIRVICNLKMGGTNPGVIKTLRQNGVDVRQSDNLHAKVYIGNTEAVVTSANASINGLGLEGTEVEGWIEAGVFVNRDDALRWFDRQWEECRAISPADLNDARKNFGFHHANRPTRTFAAFDTTAPDLPIIEWVRQVGNYDHNVDNIAQVMGLYNAAIEERVDLGYEVQGHEDHAFLRPGTWVLYWFINSRTGMPIKSRIPEWNHLSNTLIPNAIRYDGEEEDADVILPTEVETPEPFNAADPHFRNALYDTLALPNYAGLRDLNLQGGFVAPRRHLMNQCWRDIKAKYLQLAQE